jgi:hypothetical protein
MTGSEIAEPVVGGVGRGKLPGAGGGLSQATAGLWSGLAAALL